MALVVLWWAAGTHVSNESESGLRSRLPDFGPIFERYAADLKAEAER